MLQMCLLYWPPVALTAVSQKQLLTYYWQTVLVLFVLVLHFLCEPWEEWRRTLFLGHGGQVEGVCSITEHGLATILHPEQVLTEY